MANVQSAVNHQTSEGSAEGLTPSSLLEQMSFSSFSHLRSPDSSEVEEAVPWLVNYTENHLSSDQPNALEVCTDVPLHPYEAPSASHEETLNHLDDIDLFQLSDQTRAVKPVNLSEFFIGDPHPCLPKRRSEIFPSHHHPYVTFRLMPSCSAPVLDTTVTHSPHFPHFICISQANHTASELNIKFTPPEPPHSCPAHQPIPPYPRTPSRVNVKFSSHLCVLSSNPAVHQPTNAEHPSETLNRDRSWHTRRKTSSASLRENFSVWQRFIQTAKRFYSNSPHVQALACFFT